MPLPSTGLFRNTIHYHGYSRFFYKRKTFETDIKEYKTKDLDEVSHDFQRAQVLAILSATTFFAASCVYVAQFAGVVPQSVGRFAGFVHLVGAVFAVICGSVLLGAVHKNQPVDDLTGFLTLRDNERHSFSECGLNYGIPFIFVAAGLGITNYLLFFLTGWAGAAPAPADNTADVEAEAAPAKEVYTTEPAQARDSYLLFNLHRVNIFVFAP